MGMYFGKRGGWIGMRMWNEIKNVDDDRDGEAKSRMEKGVGMEMGRNAMGKDGKRYGKCVE